MDPTPLPDPNERPGPQPDPTPDRANLRPILGETPHAAGSHPAPVTVQVTVSDPLGLHLRSGREVVRVASQFDATITAQNVSRPSDPVDAKSILQLMQLQARRGHVLLLSAHGPDADQALAALSALFI